MTRTAAPCRWFTRPATRPTRHEPVCPPAERRPAMLGLAYTPRQYGCRWFTRPATWV